MDSIAILLPPFVACLLLAAIHVYLGYHVIAREVIFVDLSLAQIAAFGAILMAAAGYEPGDPASYLGSLALALTGAAIFSFTGSRHRHDERVPQEATIGIVYAVATAAVILVASKLTHGAQEIERMLVGSILWVSWPTLAKTAVIYAAVAAFHYALRKPFFAISTDPKGAHQSGLPVRRLDFAFYASFSVAITSSVAIAGVLLVFAFLVVPATAGVLVADGVRDRLLAGWAVALAASITGLAVSWFWDLPTGAAIVAALGGILLLIALVRTARAG